MKSFHLTTTGLEELKGELAALYAQRNPIIDRIKTARELGDLAENAEYQSARMEQERVEHRINEIEHILRNTHLLKAPTHDGSVQLGSSIVLEHKSRQKELMIVDTVEADPLNGKVSGESPIGQALLGKRAGDSVIIKTPVETITYRIVSIA